MQIVDDITEHIVWEKIGDFLFEISHRNSVTMVSVPMTDMTLHHPEFYHALSQAHETAQLLDTAIDIEYSYMVARDFDRLDEMERDLEENENSFKLVEYRISKLRHQNLVPVGILGAALIDMMDKISLRKAQSLPPPTGRPSRAGFVYILRASTGDYKIGKTINPKDRIKTFGVKLPFRVQYELVIHSDDYTALEVELHQRFDYCHLDGEWYGLTDGDIEDLRREFSERLKDFNNE